jgi:hypothetical protein
MPRWVRSFKIWSKTHASKRENDPLENAVENARSFEKMDRGGRKRIQAQPDFLYNRYLELALVALGYNGSAGWISSAHASSGS